MRHYFSLCLLAIALAACDPGPLGPVIPDAGPVKDHAPLGMVPYDCTEHEQCSSKTNGAPSCCAEYGQCVRGIVHEGVCFADLRWGQPPLACEGPPPCGGAGSCDGGECCANGLCVRGLEIDGTCYASTGEALPADACAPWPNA